MREASESLKCRPGRAGPGIQHVSELLKSDFRLNKRPFSRHSSAPLYPRPFVRLPSLSLSLLVQETAVPLRWWDWALWMPRSCFHSRRPQSSGLSPNAQCSAFRSLGCYWEYCRNMGIISSFSLLSFHQILVSMQFSNHLFIFWFTFILLLFFFHEYVHSVIVHAGILWTFIHSFIHSCLIHAFACLSERMTMKICMEKIVYSFFWLTD